MKTTNNNIQIFNNSNFGTIRTITNAEGETFFVGRDVATALGYSNTRDALNRHVDKEDRDGVVIHDSIGRQQKAVIINESGLYALILSSQLEQARAFKHWVTAEVLPQIRRTGRYEMTERLHVLEACVNQLAWLARIRSGARSTRLARHAPVPARTNHARPNAHEQTTVHHESAPPTTRRRLPRCRPQ